MPDEDLLPGWPQVRLQASEHALYGAHHAVVRTIVESPFCRSGERRDAIFAAECILVEPELKAVGPNGIDTTHTFDTQGVHVGVCCGKFRSDTDELVCWVLRRSTRTYLDMSGGTPAVGIFRHPAWFYFVPVLVDNEVGGIYSSSRVPFGKLKPGQFGARIRFNIKCGRIREPQVKSIALPGQSKAGILLWCMLWGILRTRSSSGWGHMRCGHCLLCPIVRDRRRERLEIV